jgi:probable FeS assembly SUF system protein SufT
MDHLEPEVIKLKRGIKAVEVPFGREIKLPRGLEVIITQALGTSYTIIAGGQMFRVSEKYADALSKKIKKQVAKKFPGRTLKDKIWAQLKTCYDPEIPVNIVDLGLVYEVKIIPLKNKMNKVIIRMTLTAPGCGMGPIIANEAKEKVLELPKVKEVLTEFVFDPPWDRSRLSDQAKLILGIL